TNGPHPFALWTLRVWQKANKFPHRFQGAQRFCRDSPPPILRSVDSQRERVSQAETAPWRSRVVTAEIGGCPFKPPGESIQPRCHSKGRAKARPKRGLSGGSTLF